MNAGPVFITPIISKLNSPPEIRLLWGHTPFLVGRISLLRNTTRPWTALPLLPGRRGPGRGGLILELARSGRVGMYKPRSLAPSLFCFLLFQFPHLEPAQARGFLDFESEVERWMLGVSSF
jgi:hypothetical protein